jgi:hypothetical protein
LRELRTFIAETFRTKQKRGARRPLRVGVK